MTVETAKPDTREGGEAASPPVAEKPAEAPAAAGSSGEKPLGPAAKMVVGKVAEHEERLRRVEAATGAPAADGKPADAEDDDPFAWLTLF